MGGRGPAPKDAANRQKPKQTVHEWQFAGGVGWQYGEVPKPPPGLKKASRDAWAIWFGSWVAWFWEPEMLPGLRQVIRLYDAVESGDLHRAGEMRLEMEAYGLTPKGQQDRRWRPPKEESAPAEAAKVAGARVRHLRVADLTGS